MPHVLTGRSRHQDTQRRQGADMALRAEVTRSWNHTMAQKVLKVRNADGTFSYYANGATPFRAVMNNQDPLNRYQYQCGGGGIFRRRFYFEGCDGTNVPCVSGNPKQYWQQADYIRYKAGRQILAERNRDVYSGAIAHVTTPLLGSAVASS